ncbi:IclR family transcriptional regulator [Pelagibius sp. Alg239-R121]|uniref:IclR family transcriptional regulator n=1 Tax=Pelagibius sp. Alg239-R121 TaxID=2993448 RepID=UPI0024A75249|nr:IclR family transcriptional regulator [Pelagibius sp. Alg239-R121]
MRDDDTKPAKKSRARGLERAFAIIDYLHAGKEPKRPFEIAVGMEAPKSSVYELVGILTGLGVLERTDDEGRVFLGRKLHFWGLGYLDNFDLTRLALPVLERLTDRTRETSQLCMIDGNKYTVVMMNEGSRQFRISADVGERIPIPWTASGRLLLGHMTDTEILEFVPDEDFVLPDGTHLDKSDYITSIRAAHAEGFFSFDSVADTYTHCFAAPINESNGHCVATVCLIAPKQDAQSNFPMYRDVLIQAAKDLTSELKLDPIFNGLAAE